MDFKAQEKEYEDKDQIMDIKNESGCNTGYDGSNYIDQNENYCNMPMPCGMMPYGMIPFGVVPGMPGMMPGMMPAPAQYYPPVDDDTIYNNPYCDSENENDEQYDNLDNMTRSRRRRRRRRQRYDYPYYPGGFPFWLWWFL